MSTILADPAELPVSTGNAGTAVPRRRRVAGFLAGALAAIALFAVHLRLARTRAINSNGSSQALQAWDVLHGNLLMHGWVLTDVSFTRVSASRPAAVPFASSAANTTERM